MPFFSILGKCLFEDCNFYKNKNIKRPLSMLNRLTYLTTFAFLYFDKTKSNFSLYLKIIR